MTNREEKRTQARELVLQLPDVMRVGAYDIDITKWDAVHAGSGNSFGEFNSARLEIGLCQDFPSPAKAAYTFLHEIMHAVWFVYGIKENDEEERIVTLMSLGWTQVHADNPWLIGWVQAALHGQKEGAADLTPQASQSAASSTAPRQAGRKRR